jgi:hypothetical protein
MKYRIFTIALSFSISLLLPSWLSAEAIVRGQIKNMPKDSLSFTFPMYAQTAIKGTVQLTIQQDEYQLTADLQEPAFIQLKCGAYHFNLILKPKDGVHLDFDARDMRNTFYVKGSPANSYYLKSKCNPLWSWTATEKEPDHLSTFLQFMDMIQQEKKMMQEYGISGHILSLLEYEADYFFIDQMMLLTRDYPAYDRPIYMAEIDALLTTALMNNKEALPCPSYEKFLFNLAEYQWKYKSEDVKKSVFPAYETSETNILVFSYAFWKKNLKEEALELVLATCLNHWKNFYHIRITQEIYEAFKKEFPGSRYQLILESSLSELLTFWEIALPEKQELEVMTVHPENLEELQALFGKKVTILFIWKSGLDLNGVAKKAMIQTALAQTSFNSKEVNCIFLTIEDRDPVDQSFLLDRLQYYRLKGRHLLLEKRASLSKLIQKEILQDFRVFPPVMIFFDKKGKRTQFFSSFQIKKDRILEEVERLLQN